MKIIKYAPFLKFQIILLFFISLSVQIQSQIILDPNPIVITGDLNPSVNAIRTYQASALGATIFSGTWLVPSGGVVQSQTATTVTIKWITSGPQKIKYTATNSSAGTLIGYLKVIVVGATAPNPPPSPIIASQDCTSAVLQNNGTIPSGETWYWQGTNSSGTSTSLSAANNYNVTISGTYYLRARNNTSGLWSIPSSVSVLLGTVGGTTWYADTDGDGLGDFYTTLVQCSQPVGYVSNSNDVCPNANGGGSTNGCPSSAGLSNENYIYTITPQKAVTSISQLTQNKDAIKNVTYYDGLGRPMQSIAIKQSPFEKDIVTHIEYDALGRQPKEYLPYESSANDGFYKTDALIQTTNFYNTPTYQNTTNPFSEKEFEASPLNRVLKQAAPGYDWRLGGGHEIKFDYQTNTATEVKLYNVSLNASYTPTLTGGTVNFAAGQLYKNITKDENWTAGKNHTTEEFKDKQGRVVLKRTYANVSGVSTPHDTYYVYDDYGNLTYVLPPKAEATTNKPTATELNNLCYQYKYDKRNRLIEKKIPGKGWEYIVYDKLDRPVMTQDAVQKNQKKWLFTKYDVFGRVVYTGIYTHGSVYSQVQMQTLFDNNNNLATKLYEQKVTSGTGVQGSYYSNNNFPKVSIELLTVNYYDNYNFNRAGTGISATAYGVSSTTRLKGLATGSRVKVLGTSNWITTVNYYDEKARPIYTYSKNEYLNTSDIAKSNLDFVGKVIESTTLHTKTDDNLPTIQVQDFFTYNHTGSLIKQEQKIGSRAKEVIAVNTYDKLGQLKTKAVGGKTTQPRLQTVDYKYNIRGWLKEINNPNSLGNDLFAFKIYYNNPTHNTAEGLYNGNISQVNWKTNNDDTSLYWYMYHYDDLNRIKSAQFAGGGYWDRYSINNVTYDKNGNIKTLKRNGHRNAGATSFGVMDDLTYSYDSGNKLMKVADAASIDQFGFKDDAVNTASDTSDDYSYDINGNMKTDANKGITNIVYNHLNLPTQVTLSGGNITYVYDATGVKLKKTVSTGATTQYAGNYIYENNNLKFFNHAEGYFDVTSTGSTLQGDYVYQYKDHLGNIRLSYKDVSLTSTPSLEIQEENNYYPFGLEHKGYNNVVTSTNPAQKYKYNGKELQEEFGLNVYDYGARNYDAALGRWMNIDPLAEKYYNNTPYNYVNNNPLNFIDPDGRSGIATIKKDEDGNEYVEISSKIYFYGEQSSSDFAKTTASHIQKMWNDGGGTVEIDGKSYSVKFSVTGEHVTEEKATELAESNGTNAENNFVRVTDGSDWSSSAGIKSSFFKIGKNSGVFLNYEMGGKKTTDAHEMGHGYGWYEAGDHSGGRHDVYPLDANGKNPAPGIMSARGTPVYDKYGYKGQASGNKTLDPTKRAVLPSDISKLSINVSTLKANGSVNVGTASNNIYNANGTIKN